ARVLTSAPGDGQPIGGVKVMAEHGWFAARPSGTEAVYKLYAESWKGDAHLRRIQDEARAAIHRVAQAAARPAPSRAECRAGRDDGPTPSRSSRDAGRRLRRFDPMKVYAFDLLPWPYLDEPSYYPDPNARFDPARGREVYAHHLD